MAGVALAAIYEIYEALNASSISIQQLGRREYAQGNSDGRRCIFHRKTGRGGMIGEWFSAPSRR